VKVRAGNAACLTDTSKVLALLDGLAYFYANAAHVAVHSDKSLAVINHHSIAIKEVITRGDNYSCSRRVYWSAFWGRDIQTTMRTSGLAV
jgi:hypothetical protein